MTRPHDTTFAARLDANWRAIEAELDAPRPALGERALRRIGIPSSVTRLVVATPALRRAWYLAIVGVAVFGLATADVSEPRLSVLPLLIIAPLVPVLGVALAYGPAADPSHELHLATPVRGVRLVALRATVVLVTSGLIVTGVALLNGVTRPLAAAWLLPAVAVTSTSLLAMTWTSPRRAAVAAAGLWLIVVWVSQLGDDPLVVFTFVGQLLALALSGVALLVVFRRRDMLERLQFT